MAYRIDPTADVGSELRRILSEQLGAATAELTRPTGSDDEAGPGPDEKAVHDARKRIKKCRSLLRLARRGFGADVVRQAGDELRSCAAVLAPQREADAAAAVARHLADAVRRQHEGGDGDPAVAAADEMVGILTERARRGGGVDALSWSVARSVGLRLERTTAWLARVPDRADGWEALDAGLRRQYERGSAALADMGAEPSVDELHEWRKRVKDVWYHERLLRPLWPAVVGPVEDAAYRLADLLGTDHDLGLLDEALADEAREEEAPGKDEPRADEARADEAPADTEGDGVGGSSPLHALPGEQRATLRNAIAVERTEILAEARWLGGRIHADRPQAWAGRHRRWWELASQE